MNPKYSLTMPFQRIYYKKKWFGMPLPYLSSIKNVPSEISTPVQQEIVAMFVPWLMPKRLLKDICKKHNISLPHVIGVNSTAKSKAIRKAIHRKRAKTRQHAPLADKDFNLFAQYLDTVDRQSALIARIIWHLNNKMVFSGTFITLEEVLRLKTSDIETDSHMITLYRETQGPLIVTKMPLPEYIFNKLQLIIKTDLPFVFSNSLGGPLTSSKVKSDFSKAAKKARLQEKITPLSLRPAYDSKSPYSICGRCFYSNNCFEIIIPDSVLEPLLEFIPISPRNSGVKSHYSHKELLKAILYKYTSGCTWKEIPLEFPPVRAIQAQFQRWQRNGFMEKAFKYLRQLATMTG